MADCAQNCPVAGRVDALEGQLDEYQAQNSATHKEIFGRLNTLERSEAVQEVHYKDIINRLDTIAVKVSALEQKPAKRWESVIGAIIGAVVSGLVVYLMVRAGLG